jgi:hypothetical protein
MGKHRRTPNGLDVLGALLLSRLSRAICRV